MVEPDHRTFCESKPAQGLSGPLPRHQWRALWRAFTVGYADGSLLEGNCPVVLCLGTLPVYYALKGSLVRVKPVAVKDRDVVRIGGVEVL